MEPDEHEQSAVISLIKGPHLGIWGFQIRLLQRQGDRIAEYISGAGGPGSAEELAWFVLLCQYAFSNPAIIIGDEHRTPRLTLALLRLFLEKNEYPSVSDKILEVVQELSRL